MSININEYSTYRPVSPTEIGTPVSNGSSSPKSSSPSPVEAITNIHVAPKRTYRPMNPPKNNIEKPTPFDHDIDIRYKRVVEQSAWNSLEQAIEFTYTHATALCEEYRNSNNHEEKAAIAQKMAKNRDCRVELVASQNIALAALAKKEKRDETTSLPKAPLFQP